MKKFLLLICLLIVGAGIFVYLNFESGLRRGIEVAASDALGSKVTVSGISVSPLSGQGRIRGLTVANPEGFDAPYAMELGSLDVAVNLSSLVTDVIEIDSIVVNEMKVTYETNVLNDNIRALLANLPSSGAAPVVEASPDAAPSRKLIIRDLRMLSPRIDLYTKVASAPVPLPDIQLQNIGEQSNAVTVAEAARQIIVAINRALVNEGVPNMDILLDGAKQQLEEGVKKVGDAVENLGNGVRSLFDR